MLSKSIIQSSAKVLGIEARAIDAVAFVECQKAAFQKDGRCTILFEPHIFWRQLIERKVDPSQYCSVTITAEKPGSKEVIQMPADHAVLPILYPHWVRGYYGLVSDQWDKLLRARRIDEAAALQSASWGMFQIMGFNWKACGCRDIDEFVHLMGENEDMHLHLFVHFLLSQGLHRHLRLRPGKKALEMDQIEAFCEAYNGKGYRANDYHNKFYRRYIKQPAI